MTPPPIDHDPGPGRAGQSAPVDLLQQSLEAGPAERRGPPCRTAPGPRRRSRSRVCWPRPGSRPTATSRTPRPATAAAPGPAGPAAASAEVRRHQRLDLVVVELALGGGVAELEAGVVVAGVLVVDQPHLVAVVDEVAGQQVVVARHRRPRRGRPAPPYPVEVVVVVEVAVEEPVAVLPHRREVRRLAPEHVEVAGEARARVQPAARLGGPVEHVGVAERGVLQVVPVEVADDQHAEVGEVVHDRLRRPRPPPRPGCWRARRPGRCRAAPASPRKTPHHVVVPGVVPTWRFWLVSPPGSSRRCGEGPAGPGSGPAGPPVVVGWSTASVVERVDDGLVDRVLGPGEPVLRRHVPPDRRGGAARRASRSVRS